MSMWLFIHTIFFSIKVIVFVFYNFSGDENFQEIVSGLIKNDDQLTDEALYLMTINATSQYTANFVVLHNIPHTRLSYEVLQLIKSSPSQQKSLPVQPQAEDECWETETISGIIIFRL